MFFCSLIYSTTVLFAWQFGAHGCFFTEDAEMFGFAARQPWWFSVIFATVMLAWISMVTVPTYSLVLNASPAHTQPGGRAPYLNVRLGPHLFGGGGG